jgi:hypothetical protein
LDFVELVGSLSRTMQVTQLGQRIDPHAECRGGEWVDAKRVVRS